MIADADGQASRFLSLLTEYQKAPRVTRDRLYIDAVEEVYRNSNKVILDSKGSGNLLYLPIDKLIGEGKNRANNQNTLSTSGAQNDSSDVSSNRDRRQRQ